MVEIPHFQYFLLAFCWLIYFGIHSLLADLRFKSWTWQRWPGLKRYYRLLYNIQAVVLLIPAVWLLYSYPGDELWSFDGVAFWIANGLAVGAIAAVILAPGGYDLGLFSGLTQSRGALAGDAEETFKITLLHRFVRHPWYSVGLVLIWTRDMSIALLISAIAMSLYFVIGSRLEEQKLVTMFGESYARYRKLVPALIPLPWRWLRKSEARQLLDDSNGSHNK